MLAITAIINDQHETDADLLEGVNFRLPDGRMMRIVLRKTGNGNSRCRMLIQDPRDVQVIRDSAVIKERS